MSARHGGHLSVEVRSGGRIVATQEAISGNGIPDIASKETIGT